jgi:hypothetical protein
MTHMKARLAVPVVAIATAFGFGCTSRVVTVGALDVAPDVSLGPRMGRISLALARGTPDAIRIQGSGFPSVEVRAFRTTLRRAFERAFPPSALTDGSAASHGTLEIEVTDLSFVTDREGHAWRRDVDRPFGGEIVLTHGTAMHAPRASARRVRYAQFRFVASLRQRGVEVARLAGLATADEPTAGGAQSIAASLGSAVAVLYQRIARELFLRRTALAPRSP